MLIWTSAHRTDVGTRRRVNEDAVLTRAEQGFWLVADGMGGHAAGEYASQAMVRAFEDLQVRNRSLVELVDEVDERIKQVNQHLLRYARSNNVATVGTTVALLVLTKDFGFCTWVGDTRMYLVRQGHVIQMTQDHSLVHSLVAQGQITLEEAEQHPSRNVLMRAVGAGPVVQPAIQLFQPQNGDIYVLCSDGFYHEVHDSVMAEVVQECHPREASEALMESALSEGADDNVSLIVVRLRDSEH